MEGKKLPRQYARSFNELQFFPERLEEPLKHKTPATIFVGSMCDIFDRNAPLRWVEEIINIINMCPQHTFMLLTKRPADYTSFNWPPNCILGVTIEAYKSKQDRLLCLSKVPGRKFLSIEPILGDFSGVDLSPFELVIVGADSTPWAPIPNREWIDSIRHPNIHYKKNILKHFPDLKSGRKQ